MHVRGVEPDEEGLARVVLALHEVLGRRNKFVVARFHALFRERAGVGHSLFSDFAPTRLFGRIVLVGRPGMHHPARSKSIAEVREILLVRVVLHFRLFFGVEVIEVAEELVEAVVGRQHVVEIAEMVLAELAGRVALVLEAGGDGDELLRHADRRARDADLGEAGAIDALPGDEGRASRRAGLFAVGIGEHHAFLGDAVDVGRPVAHEAVRIAAQIRDADVVAPDDEDVRLFVLAISISSCWYCSFRCSRGHDSVHYDLFTVEGGGSSACSLCAASLRQFPPAATRGAAARQRRQTRRCR